MTTCYFCKGRIEQACVDYMYHAADRYALIKGLPVERCVQCGEVYLDDDASRRIDAALASADTVQEHLDVPVVHA